jgi:hypothetical protein
VAKRVFSVSIEYDKQGRVRSESYTLSASSESEARAKARANLTEGGVKILSEVVSVIVDDLLDSEET